MTKNIRKELNEAKKAYQSKNYEDALNIYEKHFIENPENLNEWDKIFYSWSLYQIYIKDCEDEDKLFQAAETVTELIEQEDLTKKSVCAYTFSVFKVLDYLYVQKDYYTLIVWLEKIDSSLLDQNRYEKDDRVFRSRKEKYFDYATKSYFECNDFERCIEVSKEALSSLNKYTNNSDIWYRWRIAKSLKELFKNKEALIYLNEVLKVKKDWFVFKEIAENYYILKDCKKAQKYLCDAVLTNDPIRIKVNLYYLAYKILKDINPDIAHKHIELFYAIKMENDSKVPEDIGDLLIEDEHLDKKVLEREIKDYWTEFKFKDKKLQYGTVTKIFEHGKSGFITSDDNESVYFNVYEFKEGKASLGQYVSFFTEKSFDKTKNRESVRAIHIKAQL